MKIDLLGGAGEIGASSILVRLGDKKILMDCGIRQGKAGQDPLPNLRILQDAEGIDAIVVSHAHMDHIGALPLISKTFPEARLYMTRMTKDLVHVLLYDSLKIMNNREAEIPFYSEQDVEGMLNRTFTINYQTPFDILEGITLSFYPAGHIAGAACCYLTSKEGNVFYSGDFALFPQNTIEGAKIPKLRPDVGIFESTYGDKLHGNRQIEENRLVEEVAECLAKKGKVLIPAFALGRAQEVLLILKRAMNKGTFPKVKIYADGMVRDINRMYKLNPLYLRSSLGKKILKGVEPFYDDWVQAVAPSDRREELANQEESCIIVSSSGMLSGGPSELYAEKLIGSEKNSIIFTGYQDEEAPGRKLLNLLEAPQEERRIELRGKHLPVKCKISRVGLSAHGDKNEIKALITMLSPKYTLLVHGDNEVIKLLAKDITADIRTLVYTPQNGDALDFDIINPRKQFIKAFSYKMNEKDSFIKASLPQLWAFIKDHYYDKLFTIEELLTIWYGKGSWREDELTDAAKLFMDAPYFTQDMRRFFLFKASEEAIVIEALKSQELKPNELAELAERYFSQYDCKKVSYLLSERKVVLNFDFPRVVKAAIKESIAAFEGETSWQVAINENTNTNAAEALIRSLLQDVMLQKMSYFIADQLYTVKVDQVPKAEELLKESFNEQTGLRLELIYEGATQPESKMHSESPYSVDPQNFERVPMEQNKALHYIGLAFSDQQDKPYKKSIKGMSQIELCFLSPTVGLRYMDKLKLIANEIGWRLSISQTINQNELMARAIQLCREQGLTLMKNPSYNPMTSAISIKIAQGVDEAVLQVIKEQFYIQTGCNLLFL